MKKQIDDQPLQFGQILKTFRKRTKVSQQEIADAAGLSKNNISALERGIHKCNAQTFITYAKVCGVSLDEMAGLMPTSKVNKKNKQEGLELLSTIADGFISACFFDPQYRGILDKMQYGNEGAREKSRCELMQMDEFTIRQFIMEINRVLKDSAYLFLWVDKFHLCEGIMSWFEDTDLNVVDLIVWDKGKIGMGYRTRRRSEYLLILQKSPVRAKGSWKDHGIPDVWKEKAVGDHPHSKPIELQKRLLSATTSEGDTVLDPASGGYSVYKACREINRNFLGCDIEFGEE